MSLACANTVLMPLGENHACPLCAAPLDLWGFDGASLIDTIEHLDAALL